MHTLHCSALHGIYYAWRALIRCAGMSRDEFESDIAAAILASLIGTPMHPFFEEHLEYLHFIIRHQVDGIYTIIKTLGDGSCGGQALAACLYAIQGIFDASIEELKTMGLAIREEVRAVCSGNTQYLFVLAH